MPALVVDKLQNRLERGQRIRLRGSEWIADQIRKIRSTPIRHLILTGVNFSSFILPLIVVEVAIVTGWYAGWEAREQVIIECGGYLLHLYLFIGVKVGHAAEKKEPSISIIFQTRPNNAVLRPAHPKPAGDPHEGTSTGSAHDGAPIGKSKG